MTRWIDKLKYYCDPKVLSVLFLGFSSGLPFLLTLATLHVWLSETGVSKTTIGLFVLVTLPYSFKFLWAPVIDHKPFPVLTRLFGQRRGWLLGAQLGVLASLVALGATNPQENIALTAFLALIVALCSATQDIVYEAFRVEILPKTHVGPGAGASSFGYRLGMWVAGAGSLYLASFFSWSAVYAFMALSMLIGVTATLFSTEPHPQYLQTKKLTRSSIFEFFQTSVVSLFKRSDVWVVLSFIFLYKISDTVLNTLTMPFLLEIGFSKLEIAHVAKSFGIAVMMVGGLIGGLLLVDRPLSQVLLWVASLQLVASLMFMCQAIAGYDLTLLFITIGCENFACGLGTAAYIVFLSSRCQAPFTGTHFAVLTSFGSLCRIFISAIAGIMADHLTWPSFYGLAALLTFPCFLLIWSQRHQLQLRSQEAFA